jgi:hypothetical protein
MSAPAAFLVVDGQWAADRAREMILWAGYPTAEPKHVNAVGASLLAWKREREANAPSGRSASGSGG